MNDEETPTAPAAPVQVTIFNQPYNLRSDSDGERVRQLAQLVDERMRQISAQLTTHDVGKIAVLAALNIADELQRTKDYYEREVQPLLLQASREATEAEAERAGVESRATPERATPERATPEREPESWFEAIFDSPAPAKERGERLSSQIAAKLQSLRQVGQREHLTIEAETDKDES
jgi:cell division protein ZapA